MTGEIMDIENAKARVKELLSQATLKDAPDDSDPYYHLEVDEWLELDGVKHDLAREVDSEAFQTSYSDRSSYEFDFVLGEGLATATLRYKVSSRSFTLPIDLAGDPSTGSKDSFLGDDHQIWTLFHSLPAHEQEDFMSSVEYTYGLIPDEVSSITGPVAPEPDLSPAEKIAASAPKPSSFTP